MSSTITVKTDKHTYLITTSVSMTEAHAWLEQRTRETPRLSGLRAEALCRTYNSWQMTDAVTRYRQHLPVQAQLIRLIELKIDDDPINYTKNNQKLLSIAHDLGESFKNHRSQETLANNINWAIDTEPYKKLVEAVTQPDFVSLGWSAGVVSNARLLNNPRDYYDDEIRSALRL